MSGDENRRVRIVGVELSARGALGLFLSGVIFGLGAALAWRLINALLG